MEAGRSHAMNDQDPTARREGFDARVSGIAALGEPLRRALYRYVAGQPSPVSRDDAAEGVGLARHVAKFHLDKLADDVLLDVEFRRPPVEVGPAPDGQRSSIGGLSAGWRSASPTGATTSPRGCSPEPSQTPSATTPRSMWRSPSQRVTRGACSANGPEPHLEAAGIGLANCPFHVRPIGLDACLEPSDGMCCVRLRKQPGKGSRRV